MKKKGLLTLIVILLTFSLVSAGQLQVTNEHPFLINRKWIPASSLEIGDELTTLKGDKIRITNIKDIVLDEPISVYNLEAGVFHDFIVEEGVVVHNSDEIEKICSLCDVEQGIQTIDKKLKSISLTGEIDIKNPAVRTWENNIEKISSGKKLNEQEISWMYQFTIDILNLQNVEYKIESGKIILLQGGSVGEVIKRFNERGYRVTVDPYNPFSIMDYDTKIVTFDISLFFHTAAFRATSKHEWGHLLKIEAFAGCENPSLELLSDTIFIRPAERTTAYGTFSSDEFNQYIGGIHEIAQEGLLEKPYYIHQGLIIQPTVLKNLVKEGEVAVRDSKEILESIGRQKLSRLSVTFEKILKTNEEYIFFMDLDGTGDYEKSVIFRIDNHFGKEVIEIQTHYFIKGQDGKLHLFVTNPKSIETIKSILQEHKVSRKAKEQLVDILKKEVMPQINYLDLKVSKAKRISETIPSLIKRLQEAKSSGEGNRARCNLLELLERSVENEGEL